MSSDALQEGGRGWNGLCGCAAVSLVVRSCYVMQCGRELEDGGR